MTAAHGAVSLGTRRPMRVSCQATNPGGRQRLILPGDAQFNQGPGQQSSRLIIPGQGNSRQGGSSSLSMNQTRDFRPPPGFMDLDSPDAATKPDPSDGPSLPAEVMLERLSRESDAWTTLARFLGQLVPLGYDSATVEEVAGVERRRQHLWLTALQVYTSLAKDMKKSDLEEFEVPGGDEILAELKFLTHEQRLPAVRYIQARQMDAQSARVLARAIKEWVRREGDKQGFSNAPADCLAFKYYRDSIETRDPVESAALAKSGLDLAVTPSARQALGGLLEPKKEPTPEEAAAAKLPRLSTLHLMPTDLGTRLLPIAGAFESTAPATLRACPRAQGRGDFFSTVALPAGSSAHDWVALPLWPALAQAGTPAGLRVANCSVLQAGMGSAKAGPGLLVVDVGPASAAGDGWRLVESAAQPGGLSVLRPGEDAAGASHVAAILFLCRPPAIATGAAAKTSELLSL
uniref:Uncharacterized protein n=2 Tax=Auxenochlorella protothecoides TaxID=3075 RepID=A0A1D2A4V5_AUXPR